MELFTPHVSSHEREEMAINVDVEMLIHAVHEQPAIWDMKCDDYGDRDKKRKAWEDLTQLFVAKTASIQEKQEMGKILQNKWKNIRDKYSKDKKGIKSSISGRGERKKRAYIYTKQLSFLEDIVTGKSTSKSFPTEEETYLRPRSCRKIVQKSKLPFKREKNLVPVEEVITTEAVVEEKQTSQDNDDMHFLLSLLPTLRQVPLHLKLSTRMEMMEVLVKKTQQHFPQQNQNSAGNSSHRPYQPTASQTQVSRNSLSYGPTQGTTSVNRNSHLELPKTSRSSFLKVLLNQSSKPPSPEPPIVESIRSPHSNTNRRWSF